MAYDKAREQLVGDAAAVFNGELIELIDSIRRDKEQTIDHESLDTVLRAEWEGDAAGEREGHGQDFQSYLEAHRDRIEALGHLLQPAAPPPELTYAMIREVCRQAEERQTPSLGPIAGVAGLRPARRIQAAGAPASELDGPRGLDPPRLRH